MSDEAPIPWCPGCAPERDQMLELLETMWCGLHLPSRDGLDDAGVVLGGEVIGEAAQQRAWCSLIHRDRAEVE